MILVVKWWTRSIREKVLHKLHLTNINSLDCLISDPKIHLHKYYRCQVTTHFEWDPLIPVWSWQTLSLLLLYSSLASNRLFPDMGLTSILLVSSWGDEVIPTFESVPPIGSPPFNISNLSPRPDIPLTPKFSKHFLPWVPNKNHYFPPIDINFEVNPVLVWPHKRL